MKILLVEWQEVPSLWDAVRYEVDQRGELGQFILTGSSTPTQKGILHSGAGRIGSIRMRPMSLYESGESSGVVSLQAICRKDFTNHLVEESKIEDLAHFIIRGGWPGSLSVAREDAYQVPREYLHQVINHDIYRLEGVNRDTNKMEALLRSLARNESTTASIQTLIRDISFHDGNPINRETVSNYLALFDRLFLIEDQKAFSSNIRSSVPIKQQAKRHFVDPSLPAALLGVTEEALIQDLNTFGFLFESLCERDLLIYAESFGGKLFHYQDYKGNEIDAVISFDDGDWAAFEIKLGAGQIDKAAKHLLAIKKQFAEDGLKGPEVLCVLCGLSHAAYQREDGVYVVPITALRE